jgi:hypothetical protein
MLRTTLICCLLLTWFGVNNNAQGQEPKPTRSLTKDVLAIQFDGGGVTSLEFALWEDGYCVWRGTEKNDKGIFEHRCAKLPGETFAKTVADLKHSGFFADKSLADQKVGPDGAHYELVVQSKDAKLTMLSWHEPYEANGKVYASGKRGLVPLDGETRLAKLKQEPAEYLYYRMAWLELKSTLLDVRPSESKLCTGKVQITTEGLVWQE